MAKLKMKKIEIAALADDRKQITELLQMRGIVEISESGFDELRRVSTAENVSQFEKSAGVALSAKAILDEYVPQKKSMVSSMLLTPVDSGSFKKYSAERDDILGRCYELITLQKSIAELKAENARIQAQSDALRIWLPLDLPMKFKGTALSSCFIGSLPNQLTEADILVKIAAVNPKLEMFDVEIISSFKEATCIAVICHADIADGVLSAFREIGFVSPNDPANKTPKQRLEELEAEHKKNLAETEKATAKIKSFAGNYGEIEFIIDYLSIRREKYLAYQKIGYTKNTFVITGYVPERYAARLIDELEKNFTLTVNLFEPEEDDDVPTLLKNNAFASPVEPITEMFAMPSRKEIDPNAIMSFFYYLFFGMMLSDAGYGLLIVIFTAFVLRKETLKPSLRKSLKMFFYCGISTIFWGAMFGSWFGDIVQVVAKQFFDKDIGSLAIWFEPIKDPMKLLLYALGFGTVHLFFGLGIKFVQLWKAGQKLDAILDVIPIYIFVIGAAPLAVQILAPVPESFITIGKYMALFGTALIIFTSARGTKNPIALFFGGLYGMYGIASGYLSDILSYSRLLALGLATGSIAGVVNLMGTLSDNKIMKAIMLIVVFIFGHALNIAINMLGAYVHTNRLQFVEFFSRFYEGGGRAFAPLKVNTKYIHLKEETQNG